MIKFEWVEKILNAANFIVEIEKQSVAEEILASVHSNDLYFIANQLANNHQNDLNMGADLQQVARMTGCAENEVAP